MVFVILTTLTLVVDLIKGIAVMNLWLEIMNVMMATELPNVNLMEVTAAQMSWLEMESVRMSTIFQLVKTMMKVTVDHQTSQIGQNVLIIRNWLGMDNVMIISKSNLNVIMMEVTAALISWLETDFVIISTISQPVAPMMEVIVDHQTLLIGQNVLIILYWLEMEHVILIW